MEHVERVQTPKASLKRLDSIQNWKKMDAGSRYIFLGRNLLLIFIGCRNRTTRSNGFMEGKHLAFYRIAPYSRLKIRGTESCPFRIFRVSINLWSLGLSSKICFNTAIHSKDVCKRSRNRHKDSV